MTLKRVVQYEILKVIYFDLAFFSESICLKLAGN